MSLVSIDNQQVSDKLSAILIGNKRSKVSLEIIWDWREAVI